MFDFEKFTNAMQGYSLDKGAFAWHDRMKRAVLYVCSPNMVPPQVLRPYYYDFNGNLIDALGSSHDNLRKIIANPPTPGLADAVNSAILPASTGFSINTTTISCQWSFVLIVDSQTPMQDARIQTLSPIRRTISVGYCSEEPINPATGTPNPNAILMFTKTCKMTISPTIGPAGSQQREVVADDYSIVDDRVKQVVPDNVMLYPGTPKDLVDGIHYDRLTHQAIVTPTDLGVCAGEGPLLMDNALVTPKCQLGDIVETIETGSDNATMLSGGVMGSGPGADLVPDESVDVRDLARNQAMQSFTGSHYIPSGGGRMKDSIDTSRPVSMQQLCYIYPDLDIVRIPVPPVNPWNSSPQEDGTLRNAMSSMLSASIQNLLIACGLLEISFRYESFGNARRFGLGDKDGVFYPLKYTCTVPQSPSAEANAVNLFKYYFIHHLVPVVRTIGGEFHLMCHCDATGYVLVDLIYNDYGGFNPGEGWYETSGKLGGYLVPTLVDYTHFESNASQLSQLMDGVIGKRIGGADNFGIMRPVVQSNPNDFAYTGQDSFAIAGERDSFARPAVAEQPTSQPESLFQMPRDNTFRTGYEDVL